MDEKKVAFIACVNNEVEWRECRYYLEHLIVPQGMETEVLAVWDAKSMTSGYQEGMDSTDAKYKVYLHQDTFIINTNFISDMLAVFEGNPQIGMLGCVGSRRLVVEDGKLPVGNYDAGKVFHNLSDRYLDYGIPTNGCLTVAMVDGMLMATQVDIPWREDLFQGWHFYDCSQVMEMQRIGKEIVVPYQKTPWCYHDNRPNGMEEYYKDYTVFLKEYFPDRSELAAPVAGDFLELKRKFEELKVSLDSLLEAGEKKVFMEICQDVHIRSLLEFREYCLIADIERAEESQNKISTGKRFLGKNKSKDEVLGKLRTLKHMIKRLEYDVENGAECAYLQEHYSDIAISRVIQEYVWDRIKIERKYQICFRQKSCDGIKY